MAQLSYEERLNNLARLVVDVGWGGKAGVEGKPVMERLRTTILWLPLQTMHTP